jgi:hypothetical protein
VGDFRTFHKTTRVPARAMEPVIDPAGWSESELGDVANWSYRFTGSDVGELADAVAALKKRSTSLVDVDQQTFPLPRLAEVMRDVHRELIDGRGIVMLQGFPVTQFDRVDQVIAYLGVGAYLGRRIAQNASGHLLGHVKDLGGDYSDPNVRSYVTRAELHFHTDAAEYVGLLCLHGSKSGGESRIASSVTVYNHLLAKRPDVVKLLLEDWHFTKSGEHDPGELPYFTQPIMGFVDGYFSAGAIGAIGIKSQSVPGVPRWTPAQAEAVKVYQDAVEECAIDIPFCQGDIQFLNNHVMLHSRRSFEDWPDEARKRHLLRLWLQDPTARPIPDSRRNNQSGRGLMLSGMNLVVPLDAVAA